MSANRRALGALTLVLAAVVNGGAGAWETPVMVGTPVEYRDGLQLSVSPGGGALLAWSAARPPENDGGWPPASRVDAVWRGAGADHWTRAVRLSPADELAFNPASTVLPSGERVVVWSRAQRGVGDTTALEATASGTAWALRALDARVSLPYDPVTSGAGSDGTLGLAAGQGFGGSDTGRLLVRSPSGSWSDVQDVPGEDPVIQPLDDGSVVAAWMEAQGRDPRTGEADRTALMVSMRPSPTSAWAPASAALTVDGDVFALELHPVSGGRALALWAQRGVDGSPSRLMMSARPAGGTFGPATLIGIARFGVPSIAVHPDGAMTLAWWSPAGTFVRDLRPDGTTVRTVRLAGGPCVPYGQAGAIAVGTDGTTLLAGTAAGVVRAWRRDPAGTWSRPVWLSHPRAQSPVAAIDGAGEMHVAWTHGSSELWTSVEAASSRPGDWAVPGVRQDPVPVLSRLRVGPGPARARVVQFDLSRRARVTITVSSRRPGDLPRATRVVLARRGMNVVRLHHLNGLGQVPPPLVVSAEPTTLSGVTGCPARSAAFRLGAAR